MCKFKFNTIAEYFPLKTADLKTVSEIDGVSDVTDSRRVILVIKR